MDRLIPRSPASAGPPFRSPSKTVCCSICEQPVSLESARADEYGRTIHEECYTLKMKLKVATSPPAA